MYVHTDVPPDPFELSLLTSVPTPILSKSSCSELNILDQFCVIFTIKLHRKYREEGLNVPSASLSNVNTLLQPLKLLYATRYRPPTLLYHNCRGCWSNVWQQMVQLPHESRVADS